MKRMHVKILSLIFLALSGLNAKGATVKTELSGLEPGDSAVITISSETILVSKQVKSNGSVDFADVIPGLHSVKVEASGYNLPKTLQVRVNEDGSVEPAVGIKLVVTKMDDEPDNWHHVWESDGSVGGYTQTSHINTRPEVEFLGKKVVPSDVPSMAILKDQYHIILVDEGKPWTQEYAYRILETVKTLPRDYAGMAYCKFILTEDKLTDDLTMQKEDGGNTVTISQDAFAYANPFLVNLDGVRGRFFSKRLHHALTKIVTDFGEDKGTIDQILDQRFGVSVNVPDYKELTANTTNEDSECFQEFLPSELVAIINMFEELPEGFHVTPNLKYLVRRLNGHPHPIYNEAAAVAWCQENGYIEFMVSDKGAAFSGNNEQFDTQRLILHEKTHFLWAFTFSEEIKKDWIELGGWFRDPNASSGWSTTKTTEFVSAYAHAHNPDEDMAESVAYYLKDPEKLMSRAPEKYEFIRDRIMHGTRYISSIPDHLTFEVLNLYPDYDYPGKINKVDITVTGAPDEDKHIVMEISLNHEEGFQDDASNAYVRISAPHFKDQFGEECAQYVDLWMYPVDGNGHLLRGEAIVNEYSKSGYWTCGDIIVSDNVGNARYEGRNDCVTNVFINNPDEDLISPEYESGSLRYELTEGEEEGHKVQFLNIRYKVKDNIGLRNTFARVDNDYEGWSKGGTGLTDTYGSYNEETGEAEITYVIKEYFPSANYFVTFITSYDKAGTEKTVYFSDSPDHEKIEKIFITTPNPDYKAPEIDLNRMLVYAEPTHPENPDGETKVTVTFYARDNISGVGPIRYEFRDPQGNMHGDWFYHPNFGSTYFEGDPTVWARYQITHLLPRGSAPGIWGLATMYISDKAGNEQTYNFVETLIFEPDDSEDGWELFAEVEDTSLVFGLNSDEVSNFGFTWRIIHEESGMEISGDSNGSFTRSSSQLRADISSMPGGNLILIVQALGEGGDVTTVKSRRINYPGPFIPVESILLQPSSEECRIGENITISATVLPENATDKTLTWTSSDESIATVSAEGVVIAKAVGDAVITATCGSVSATCDVHVLPILVESIVIDPTEWSGEEGSEFKISAVVLPERATDKTLTFESSDNTVATVDTEGNVKVLKEGTCVITVLTVDGSDLTAECVITSLSGVEAIFGDSSAEVDVYDMNGILLKKGCTREELKRLKPGIYILRSGDTIVKTILR
ncbi:MAG: Ig-like domain-containing protein [Muribaculaceae bacterium]|nr:Ig-like domain-containing protein [Muribaculaceae bacterium]